MAEMKSYIFFSNYLALGVITHEECIKQYPFAYIHFLLNNTEDHEQKWYFTLLTHFWQIFPLYITWKHKKTRDFLVFSGSIKWENQVLAIVNIPLKLNLCQFFILYSLKTFVRGFQTPPPLFKASISWPRVSFLFLNLCFSSTLFCCTLFYSVSDTPPPPSRNPSCPNPKHTNLLYT